MTLSLPLPPAQYRREGQPDGLTKAAREYRAKVRALTVSRARLPGTVTLVLHVYCDPLQAHQVHGGKVPRVMHLIDDVADALVFAGVVRSVACGTLDWHDEVGEARVEVTVSVML